MPMHRYYHPIYPFCQDDDAYSLYFFSRTLAKFLSILQVYHPNLEKERETIVYNSKAERKLNYNQEKISESHKNNKVSESQINYKTKQNTWESTFQTTFDTKARTGERDNWHAIGICSAYNIK